MPFRVLVIDDDESFVRILERRLLSFIPDLVINNFPTLADVREYLSQHDKDEFQLVFLDQHLPDGSGIDLLKEGWFEELAVISVSSDEAPEIPGENMRAGAMYFLSKLNLSEPLFRHLVRGVLDRNKIQQELTQARMKAERMDTIKTMVSTLQHEIYNPLGAVIGGAYLLSNSKDLSNEQKEAARLVEQSGNRIKHVVEQLSKAILLEPVQKAHQRVFHIPGDKPWEDK